MSDDSKPVTETTAEDIPCILCLDPNECRKTGCVMNRRREQTTKRLSWCPDAPRYDRGECGWPECGCPDEMSKDEKATVALMDHLYRYFGMENPHPERAELLMKELP